MKKLNLLSLAAVGALILTGCGKDANGTKVSAAKFKDTIDKRLDSAKSIEALAYAIGSVEIKFNLDLKAKDMGGTDAKESGTVVFAFDTDAGKMVSTDPEFNDANFNVYSMVDSTVNETSLWSFAGDNMTKEEFVAQFGGKDYSLYIDPYAVNYSETEKFDGGSAVTKQGAKFNDLGFVTYYSYYYKVTSGKKVARVDGKLSMSWRQAELSE